MGFWIFTLKELIINHILDSLTIVSINFNNEEDFDWLITITLIAQNLKENRNQS